MSELTAEELYILRRWSSKEMFGTVSGEMALRLLDEHAALKAELAAVKAQAELERVPVGSLAIPPGALPTNADDERMVEARVSEAMALREQIAELEQIRDTFLSGHVATLEAQVRELRKSQCTEAERSVLSLTREAEIDMVRAGQFRTYRFYMESQESRICEAELARREAAKAKGET